MKISINISKNNEKSKTWKEPKIIEKCLKSEKKGDWVFDHTNEIFAYKDQRKIYLFRFWDPELNIEPIESFREQFDFEDPGFFKWKINRTAP